MAGEADISPNHSDDISGEVGQDAWPSGRILRQILFTPTTNYVILPPAPQVAYRKNNLCLQNGNSLVFTALGGKRPFLEQILLSVSYLKQISTYKKK